MKGRFFKLEYNSKCKIVQADDTYEEYCSNAAQSFSLPLRAMSGLTSLIADKNGYPMLILDKENYPHLLSIMPLLRMTTLTIELKQDDLFMVRHNEFSLFSNETNDNAIQTDTISLKDNQTQTDNGRSLKQNRNKNSTQKNQHKFTSERQQARNTIKTRFNKEFSLIKKLILNELYSKYDEEIEKASKEKKSQSEDCDESAKTCHECKETLLFVTNYQCSQCNNYYLCEDCEESCAFNHGHSFLKLRHSQFLDRMSIERKIKAQLGLYFQNSLQYKEYLMNNFQYFNQFKAHQLLDIDIKNLKSEKRYLSNSHLNYNDKDLNIAPKNDQLEYITSNQSIQSFESFEMQ